MDKIKKIKIKKITMAQELKHYKAQHQRANEIIVAEKYWHGPERQVRDLQKSLALALRALDASEADRDALRDKLGLNKRTSEEDAVQQMLDAGFRPGIQTVENEVKRAFEDDLAQDINDALVEKII